MQVLAIVPVLCSAGELPFEVLLRAVLFVSLIVLCEDVVVILLMLLERLDLDLEVAIFVIERLDVLEELVLAVLVRALQDVVSPFTDMLPSLLLPLLLVVEAVATKHAIELLFVVDLGVRNAKEVRRLALPVKSVVLDPLPLVLLIEHVFQVLLALLGDSDKKVAESLVPFVVVQVQLVLLIHFS